MLKKTTRPILINHIEPHSDFNCLNIGLVIDKEHPWIGASPDACFRCTCCGFVVEIKCPYSLRDTSLSKTIQQQKFYVTGNNESHINIIHKSNWK